MLAVCSSSERKPECNSCSAGCDGWPCPRLSLVHSQRFLCRINHGMQRPETTAMPRLSYQLTKPTFASHSPARATTRSRSLAGPRVYERLTLDVSHRSGVLFLSNCVIRRRCVSILGVLNQAPLTLFSSLFWRSSTGALFVRGTANCHTYNLQQ